MRLIDAGELKERFCEENCGKNRCVDHMDECAWILSVEEAIIIIDMPDNCTKCTFIHRDYCSSVESFFCGVNHKRLSFSHVDLLEIQ